MKSAVMDVLELRREIVQQLERRRKSSEPGDYGDSRDKRFPLYAVTGAAKLHAELGIDLGDLTSKKAWAKRINSFQEEDGTFNSPSGKQHAAVEAIVALNILGDKPSRPVNNLAPRRSELLLPWLQSLDWSGTHKDFGAGAAPILASGLYDENWITTLQDYVNGLISPHRPLDLWCGPDDAPWRVISCIYHVIHGYDAALLPYPYPEFLWQRLCNLKYEEVRNDVHHGACTDFDFIYILGRLVHQLPDRFQRFIQISGILFEKRHEEWRHHRNSLFQQYGLHALACYLIGWCILQRTLPDQFKGPVLYDVQNAPWLYRVPEKLYNKY